VNESARRSTKPFEYEETRDELTLEEARAAPTPRVRAPAQRWTDEARRELIEEFSREGVGGHPLEKQVERMMNRLELALTYGGLGADPARLQERQALALLGGIHATLPETEGIPEDTRPVETPEGEVEVDQPEATRSPPLEVAKKHFHLAQGLWELGVNRQRSLTLALRASNKLAKLASDESTEAETIAELKAEVDSWLKDRREFWDDYRSFMAELRSTRPDLFKLPPDRLGVDGL
jgi:hypothetical protein